MNRMTLWVALGLSAIVLAAVPRGQAQGTSGRLLNIVPDSAGALRDWDNAIERMVRGDELQVRIEREDTLIRGRTIEQFVQVLQRRARVGWQCQPAT